MEAQYMKPLCTLKVVVDSMGARKGGDPLGVAYLLCWVVSSARSLAAWARRECQNFL